MFGVPRVPLLQPTIASATMNFLIIIQYACTYAPHISFFSQLSICTLAFHTIGSSSLSTCRPRSNRDTSAAVALASKKKKKKKKKNQVNRAFALIRATLSREMNRSLRNFLRCAESRFLASMHVRGMGKVS